MMRSILKCALKVPTAVNSRSVIFVSQRYFSNDIPTSSSILSTQSKFASAYEEPEYGVTDDEEFNPAHVKIAYLPDHVRQEIYRLHVSDPSKWNENELSRKFAASLTRVRAVLVLMKRREEMRNTLLGTTDGSVPPHWVVVWAKHCEDKVKYTPEALFQEFCVSGAKTATEGVDAEAGSTATSTSDAQYAKLFPTPASIKAMMDRYEEHLLRTEDLEYYNSVMEEKLQALRDHGVDITFKELREGRDLNSITGYSPRLIGDNLDEYKNEMKRLKLKILSQTSAIPAKNSDDVDKELLTFQDKLVYAPKDVENRAEIKFDHAARWKFAYKDISSLQAKTQPTMVRTRTGGFRPATPLEELNRSWYGKKPSFMDREVLYNKKFNQYADPDGDEHILTTFYKAKKARNAALAEKLKSKA